MARIPNPGALSEKGHVVLCVFHGPVDLQPEGLTRDALLTVSGK